MVFVPSTPYARMLARERGVHIEDAMPTGHYGAVCARDVLALAKSRTAIVKATPLARRMAESKGIDWTMLKGSGHAGKVLAADVHLTKAVEKRIRMSGMRRVVADRMERAHREIPPVTHTVKADVTALMQMRADLIAKGDKFSVNDFVLLAVARALKGHPQMLVRFDEGTGEIIQKCEINLGMAVALPEGLVVPVIKNAGAMDIVQMRAAAKDLAVRARENRLSPDEYKGNTFTVTNLGMYDVESFTPIINQPDAAILGVCAIDDELRLVDGSVVVKKTMRTCLTYDHRLLDGAGAAVFQQEVKRLLETPADLYEKGT